MLILFEDSGWRDLLPLTGWRCVWDLRCGIRTLVEKALLLYPSEPAGLWGRPELAAVAAARGLPINAAPEGGGGMVLLVNGRFLMDAPVPVEGRSEVGVPGGQSDGRAHAGPAASGAGASRGVAWLRLPREEAAGLEPDDFLDPARLEAVLRRLEPVPVRAEGTLLARPWDLVAQNPRQIESDFRRLPPAFRGGGRADAGAVLLNESAVVVGRGARVKPTAVLDAEAGPVYIGRNAVVSPHSYIQGPAAIGDGTLVQPGSVIRGGSSIGPVCKVGGEIEESILIGFSNKQHDGFLGHSVIGEWCNLGAGTTNSDLKNTYGPVRVEWDGRTIETGRMFVGLTMADHSKTAIGTRFPTGAMVGFACNIVLSGIAPKTVADFTWLDDDGPQTMDLDKAISVARRAMARRQRELTPPEEELFRRLAGQA